MARKLKQFTQIILYISRCIVCRLYAAFKTSNSEGWYPCEMDPVKHPERRK